MIKKVGPKKWVLYNHDGTRILGHHPTKASALRQERAINISKARASGHWIPRRPAKKAA